MGLCSSKSATIQQSNIKYTTTKPIIVNTPIHSMEGCQDTTSAKILDCDLMAVIKAFESKAHETSLSNLTSDAKHILNTFKSNVEIIRNPNINITFKKWTGDNNHMYKIRLYTSDYIEVLIHIFSDKFQETSYHNHYKPMILQNISGEYIHIIWHLDDDKEGTVYKFQKKHGEPLPDGQPMNGKLIKMLQHNYKSGNLTYIEPSLIHTVKIDKNSSNKDPVISFTIRSNLNLNDQQFVMSYKSTLPQEETIRNDDITKERRDQVLQLVIDAIDN